MRRLSILLVGTLMAAGCIGEDQATVTCAELADEVAAFVVDSADAFARDFVASTDGSDEGVVSPPDLDGEDARNPLAISSALMSSTSEDSRVAEEAARLERQADALGCDQGFANHAVKQWLEQEVEERVLALEGEASPTEYVALNAMTIVLMLLDGEPDNVQESPN